MEEDQRAKILENAFSVIDNRYEGKNVLLFDDLFSDFSFVEANINDIINIIIF